MGDEFDAFAAPSGGNDDVQDFLRKEQQALGGEADFFGGDAAPAAASGDFSEGNPFGAAAADGDADNGGQADAAAPADGDAAPFYVSVQPAYEDPYKALAQEAATASPIAEWREKRDKQLEAKDKASKEKNAAIEREAKQALEKFYQEYKTKKETQLKKNRDAQKAFVATRDAPAKGNAWERVYNLVDLNPKAQKSTKDLSRVRSVLTQLKTSPNAPGAAA